MIRGQRDMGTRGEISLSPLPLVTMFLTAVGGQPTVDIP